MLADNAMSSTKVNLLPAITLLLLAALVALFSLYVMERAKPHQRTASEDSLGYDPQQRFQWTMVTSWPKNLPGTGVAAENLARLVNEASGGRLSIRRGRNCAGHGRV